MIRFIAVLLLAVALAGCSDGGTPLTITNQSLARIEALQASGPGFSAYVGNLEPGERKKIKIYPRGEASLGLTFTANGRQFSSPASGYLESGYNVSVIVAKDMSVVVDAEL